MVHRDHRVLGTSSQPTKQSRTFQMCLFLRGETLALLEMRWVALQNSFGKTAEAIATHHAC